MTTVAAALETVPPDNSGDDPDRQTRQVEVTRDTYEQARDQIFAELPDGWRVMHLRVTSGPTSS